MSKDKDTSNPHQQPQSDQLEQYQSSTSPIQINTQIQSTSQQSTNEINFDLSLPPIQSTSIEQLQQINKQIKSIKQTKRVSIDLFNKLSLGLRCVRSFETESENEIIDEIQNISKEIIENIIEIINQRIIRNKEDIDFVINSKFITEYLDLIRRTPFDQITFYMIDAVFTICEKSSFEQTHLLFRMEIFQILIPILKYRDSTIQRYTLQFFKIIISNEWKNSSQISSSKSSLSQISSSQSHLQQLLHTSYPHPYLAELQQQGIIRTIIEDILMNEQVQFNNKYLTCELLDILNHDSIQLPNDLKSRIIELLVEQTKSDNEVIKIDSFYSLSCLALSQEYRDELINGGVIKTAADNIKRESENENQYNQIISSCTYFLNNLFIFGTKQTQQIIRNLISQETLNKINVNLDVKQFLSSYSDPETMKQLKIIERVIERRNEQQIIELIQNGLMKLMNEIITKAIQEDFEGMMLLIGEIIRSLIADNPLVSRLILDQTDFIEHNINLLNSLTLNKIKKEFISPLYEFTQNSPNEQKKQLIGKGIIQLMNKLIDSKDQEVINDVVWIIYWIIKAENKELKEGQQHPSNQILTNDGTVANLIRIIQDKDKENIHHDIALIFSYIFKTLPLPEDIKKQVLQQLKYHDDFDEIAYLAECPENHDVILSDSFVNELFKEFREYDTLQYLRLTILLLQLGSNPNKKKVALSVKDKVIRLTIDEYVDQLDDKYNWDEDKIQEINSNSRQAVQLIKSIEEEIEQEGEFEEINGIQFHINEDI